MSEHAHACCRILNYQQSIANMGYNPFIAIQIVLAGVKPINIGRVVKKYLKSRKSSVLLRVHGSDGSFFSCQIQIVILHVWLDKHEAGA